VFHDASERLFVEVRSLPIGDLLPDSFRLSK